MCVFYCAILITKQIICAINATLSGETVEMSGKWPIVGWYFKHCTHTHASKDKNRQTPFQHVHVL